MSLTIETVRLILLLMPGFVGAAVHGYLRNRTIAVSTFVILAVLLGLFAALVTGLAGLAPVTPPADAGLNAQLLAVALDPHFYAAAALAVVFGGLFALMVESRALQHLLEKAGLTRHYSTDDVWEQTFRDNLGRWLVLHLKDGRRVRGYARYYSMTGDDRTLTLGRARVSYPAEKVGAIRRKPPPLDLRGDLLILDMAGIEWVEFIAPKGGTEGEERE